MHHESLWLILLYRFAYAYTLEALCRSNGLSREGVGFPGDDVSASRGVHLPLTEIRMFRVDNGLSEATSYLSNVLAFKLRSIVV